MAFFFQIISEHVNFSQSWWWWWLIAHSSWLIHNTYLIHSFLLYSTFQVCTSNRSSIVSESILLCYQLDATTAGKDAKGFAASQKIAIIYSISRSQKNIIHPSFEADWIPEKVCGNIRRECTQQLRFYNKWLCFFFWLVGNLPRSKRGAGGSIYERELRFHHHLEVINHKNLCFTKAIFFWVEGSAAGPTNVCRLVYTFWALATRGGAWSVVLRTARIGSVSRLNEHARYCQQALKLTRRIIQVLSCITFRRTELLRFTYMDGVVRIDANYIG